MPVRRKISRHGRAGNVAAADEYRKWAGGCISARFAKEIWNSNGGLVAFWYDQGSFSQCAGQTREFIFQHGGTGAWVPPGGRVFGSLFVHTAGEVFTASLPRWEIDG